MPLDIDEQNGLALIIHTAETDQGARDWLAGLCSVVVTRNDSYLDYGDGARSGAKANEWRRAVYERDGYECRDCGARGRLHAHHVAFWSDRPDLRFVVDNGLTLCPECHATRHPGRENLIKRAHYGR